MKRFKHYISEKKIPHVLDPNKSIQHAIKDRGVDKDVDGDVDDLENIMPDEITGAETKNLTKLAKKRQSGEKKHTKIGTAYK